MTFNTISKNYAFPSLTWKKKLTSKSCLKGLFYRSDIIFSSLVLITILTSCATPHVQSSDAQLLFKSELLGFIQDGITTREEVMLKLGIPSAQFEGEIILTYQLRVDKSGNWHLVAPQISKITGFREWREETCSLVLVFDDDGVLRKHSLVEAK